MIQAKFYETYYFCNIVRNILHDQFSYLRNLNEFYGDGEVVGLVEPFKKYSTFHRFIEFIVEEVYFEEASKVSETSFTRLPIERAMDFHGIIHISFSEFRESKEGTCSEFIEDEVYEYMDDLRFGGQLNSLVEQTVKEVFHILFQNRSLLLIFNEMMADALELDSNNFDKEEFDRLFEREGKLKRKSIPRWIKRAVFFRDRGRCVLCDKDLSGMVNLENQENYDHIVPLARQGLNDVSNIQLLCKECNQNDKKANSAVTSDNYQSWYAYD